MWLLNCETSQLESFEGEDRPPYAILSHRREEKEINYQDVMAGNHINQQGWQKIKSCCEQAKRDGLHYVWVDTCCIDKKSSAELSEAINSMFRWYRQATVCYAYLADVDSSISPQEAPKSIHSLSPDMTCELISSHSSDDNNNITNADHAYADYVSISSVDASVASSDQSFSMSTVNVATRHSLAQLLKSVWFTRGWTLQELIAPHHLIFYDCRWIALGTKLDFCDAIEQQAGIRAKVLKGSDLSEICIAEKMTWAAGRKTTRVEDRAYSLLGIFNVNMPLLYGEGEKAFARLQNELIRESDDLSILAWSPSIAPQRVCRGALLASSPDSFRWDPRFTHFTPMANQVSATKGWVTAKVVLRPIGLLQYVVVLGMVVSQSKGKSRSHLPVSKIDLVPRGDASSCQSTKRFILGITVEKNIRNDHWERLPFIDECELFPEPYRRDRLDDWKAACWDITLEPQRINSRSIPSISWLLSAMSLSLPSEHPWLPGIIRPKGTFLSSRSDIAADEWLWISPSAPLRIPNKCIYIRGRGRYTHATFVIEFVYNFMSMPIARLHRLDERVLPIHFDDRENAGSDKRVLEKYSMDVAATVTRAESNHRGSPTDSDRDTAFREIEREKENGTGAEVLHIGDSVKVVFIPLEGGHRVLLAFPGSMDREGEVDCDDRCRYLPEQWLYSP